MLKLLPNPDFLKWLLSAIARARKSVVIVNYLAAMDEAGPPRDQTRLRSGRGDRKDPVARVAAALASARRRGVKVEVILEGSKFRENYAFYRLLKDAGADVWMDTSLTFIHTKAFLADDAVLCVGSHNFSASALTSHHELSVATDDRGAIGRFRAELARMTEQKAQIEDAVCRDGVRSPIESLIRIKRSISPHAYLLYLLLCREDGGRPRPIRIAAPEWAAELNLP